MTGQASSTTSCCISPFGLPTYEERWRPDQIQECVECWDLSKEDLAKLMELKDRVLDVHEHPLNGPHEMVRFVLDHASHGHLEIMEKRVRKCLEWREQNHLDHVLETYRLPKLAYHFPAAIMEGVDREGDVVVVIRQGDPLGLLQRLGKEEVFQGVFWGIEFAIRGPWQHEWKRQHGKRPQMVTAAMDLKGLNRRHYHPSLIALAHKLAFPLQMHYPHLAKKVLLINAPRIFSVVWKIFKPFIMHHLRVLMEVATEAESEILLNQYMDLHVLPEALLPDKGCGRPVPGLDPHWEMIAALPPPSDDDWERLPLVYGPDYSFPKNKKHCSSSRTASTVDSSFDSGSYSTLERNSSTLETPRVTATRLFQGTWTITESDQTLVRITGQLKVGFKLPPHHV